jgi:RNA polymerase sigma-70 factor, ECF subfamily
VANADGLFAEHQAGVFRYLRRVTGQVDAARDLTQEVFLRVSRAGAPEASDDARRAWVFRIARNLALNHLRDARRRPEATEVVEMTRPPTQEMALALDRALASLAELDREVFLLRESGGLSYGEIATACEITPDAVRSRLHRARQQLREQLSAPLVDQRARGIRIG